MTSGTAELNSSDIIQPSRPAEWRQKLGRERCELDEGQVNEIRIPVDLCKVTAAGSILQTSDDNE